MQVVVALPNDGAPFSCMRKSKDPPDFRCGQPATCLLTMAAWERLGAWTGEFTGRAVCTDHAVEAADLIEGAS